MEILYIIKLMLNKKGNALQFREQIEQNKKQLNHSQKGFFLEKERSFNSNEEFSMSFVDQFSKEYENNSNFVDSCSRFGSQSSKSEQSDDDLCNLIKVFQTEIQKWISLLSLNYNFQSPQFDHCPPITMTTDALEYLRTGQSIIGQEKSLKFSEFINNFENLYKFLNAVLKQTSMLIGPELIFMAFKTWEKWENSDRIQKSNLFSEETLNLLIQTMTPQKEIKFFQYKKSKKEHELMSSLDGQIKVNEQTLNFLKFFSRSVLHILQKSSENPFALAELPMTPMKQLSQNQSQKRQIDQQKGLFGRKIQKREQS